MPPGIPFIIGNEAAERFSFYGMKAILTVFLTHHLLARDGQLDVMSEQGAKGVFHLFTAAIYFFPIVGALVSDVLWGKYRTILLLSLGYCAGHAALALGDTGFGRHLLDPRQWLFVGLALIAVGAGGIKPCVSAHVGDQFGPRNERLLPRAFSWFYVSINVGATFSFLITPILLAHYGPSLAFGVPGLLMATAVAAFFAGRRRFVHIPPGGWQRFWRETIGADGLRALFNLSLIYVLIAPFWALFDQTGSSWVLQAESMDRRFAGIDWYSSQVGAINPFLVLVLVPAFSYGVYPWVGRWVRVTALRKIGAGLLLTVVAFAIVALAQHRIDAGARPNIAWQLLAYVVLTSAEVLVSITSLELSYTQAPRRMKSVVMAVYLLSISLGNVFTSAVNYVIATPGHGSSLAGANYFWFFTVVMLASALVYMPVARLYRGRTYLQGTEPSNPEQ